MNADLEARRERCREEIYGELDCFVGLQGQDEVAPGLTVGEVAEEVALRAMAACGLVARRPQHPILVMAAIAGMGAR